jgi:protein-disulfide isomerase
MSRARTRERRRQREVERRRQRQISIVIAVVIVAVVVFALILVANQPAEAPIPEQSTTLYADLPTATTEEGFPLIGNPDASVIVREYSSFDCPACATFHSNAVPGLLNRVRENNNVAFVYVPLWGTGGIQNGQGAARAAVCAAEQDAFWPYHTALFEWQGTYGNTAFAGNRLTTGIQNLDIDTAEWDACMSSERPDEVLRAANAAANSIEGFRGTPSVTVNGALVNATLPDINNAIDQALLTAPALEPTAEVTPEAEAPADAEAAETTPEAEGPATEEAETTPEAGG